MDNLLAALHLTLTDDVVMGLLWTGVICGVLAFLGWLAEKFEDAFDDWQKEVFHNYVDEP